MEQIGNASPHFLLAGAGWHTQIAMRHRRKFRVAVCPMLCHFRRMRQKELRIALVCYGGISLAVYMHGVTKELWKTVRASRAVRGEGGDGLTGTEAVYASLLDHLETEYDMQLRVLTDIVAGASAGGINGVFLAQAIYSGQSLEPLTELWLEGADVDVLLDPDARPWSKFAKFWAAPLIKFVLNRPGDVVSETVAPETRNEVREKLSRLIRSRWFEPPFSGIGFSRLICGALDAMRETHTTAPLLPDGHPLDLFVTATDFKGHLETLKLHSPPVVLESEHRLPIGFRETARKDAGHAFAPSLELVFAARATASFPGAFPALQVSEIDKLAAETGAKWLSRDAFLDRIMPEHARRNDLGGVALIDGSVLVNAPFADAIRVLRDRPAHREVDRRFVYIDPRPDRVGGVKRDDPRAPGFFSVIFGSLSSIPREQPVRDNLDELDRQSREMAALREITRSLRPDVENAVEKLFGRTLFLDRPTPKRLAAWRAKALKAAAEQSGYAYQGYIQVRLNSVVNALSDQLGGALPGTHSRAAIANAIFTHMGGSGADRKEVRRGALAEAASGFFAEHDVAFRIRRLRLLARRLTQDWEDEDGITEDDRDTARDAVYAALSLYESAEIALPDGEFVSTAHNVLTDPAGVLGELAEKRALAELDERVDRLLATAMADMPPALRRPVLLAYLGFPFFDTVTLPLLRDNGLSEFDPVKVDRISPDDARTIRSGGTLETLRGVEFYNFGAFFSRAYRENDYLWGRLHGAERMIDLMVSALPEDAEMPERDLLRFKREAFLAILGEEEGRLNADPSLVPGIRAEVEALCSA